MEALFVGKKEIFKLFGKLFLSGFIIGIEEIGNRISIQKALI